MQNKINSKGVSNIVATVILITLAVSAAALLYAPLREFFSGTSLAPAFSCLDWQLNPPLEVQDICLNPESKRIEAQVMQGRDILNNIQVEFVLREEEKERARWSCGGSCPRCSFNQNSEKYFLPAEGITLDKARNQSVSLEISNCLFISKSLRNC